MIPSLTLYADGIQFPESPRWHNGAFYCCSIDQGHIYRLEPGGKKKLLVDIDDGLSGWSFLNKHSEEIILTSVAYRKLFKWDGSVLTEFADLNDIDCTFLNDMTVSENGDCFVGTITLPQDAETLFDAIESPLIRVDSRGRASVASTLTAFNNGIVITPDGRTLIVADTVQQCLHAFNLASDGTLSEHRIFAQLPEGSGPDGICLDSENGVWVTSHHHVYRVLEGGAITDEIFMGDMKATACMLGGSDLRTLMITAVESHDRAVINGKLSGKVFTKQVAVPGAGRPSIY